MQTKFDHYTNEELLAYALAEGPHDDLTTELVRRLSTLIDAVVPRYERYEDRGKLMPAEVYDALYGTLGRPTTTHRK